MKYKLAIIASAILVGLIGVLVNFIDNKIPAMSMNFFRLFFAFLFMLTVVLIKDKKIKPINYKTLKHYFITGSLMAVAFSFYAIAFLFAPVANVVLINSLYVIFIPVIAFFTLHEKVSWKLTFSIIVALVGIYILNPFVPSYLAGNLFALANAITFSFFLIYLRHEEKEHHHNSIFLVLGFATIVLLPFVIYYGVEGFFEVWHYLVLLGVLSTGIAYWLLGYALQKVDANISALIYLVTLPVSSIFFAYLFLHEVVSSTTYVGGGLLLLAGFIALYKFDLKQSCPHTSLK